MKKVIIFVCCVSMIVSCGGENKVQEQWAIEEAGEIIEWYIDTLETTPQDARQAVQWLNQKINSQNQAIQDAYK